MQKLLVITNHSYMLWQFRRELLQELQKDHEVVISTPFVGREEEFRARGFRLIETPLERRGMNPAEEWKLYKQYQKLLKEEQPDKVLTYSIKPNTYAGAACKKAGIPCYINVQGLGTAFQKKTTAAIASVLYRNACKGARTVFFENEESAALFRDRKLVSPKKICVLHGAGVDTEYYSYQASRAKQETHFLYLGRIMREKGIDELFTAVRKLKENAKKPFILDLVGFFEDDYKEAIESLEKDKIARFHGFQEDPRPFYAAADCVVLPSWHEGMSNVLLEGASTGRALITSDIPGCREAVEDGKTGYLFEVKNTDALYAKMTQFLALSPEERTRMGQLGREKMLREFSKEEVVKMTAEKIRE